MRERDSAKPVLELRDVPWEIRQLRVVLTLGIALERFVMMEIHHLVVKRRVALPLSRTHALRGYEQESFIELQKEDLFNDVRKTNQRAAAEE
jgi:hypothetical protein